MRIVGGEFRGRKLLAPAGAATRPTADRTREALFNKLAHSDLAQMEDARVLDLFAGSGALGIEAISRGARMALFVEMAADARGVIRANIEMLGLQGRTKIFRRDAAAMGDVGTISPFDLVFADPPYRKGLGEKALSSLLNGGWLAKNSVCVVEDDANTEFSPPSGFQLRDQLKQSGTTIRFLIPDTE